MADEQPAALIAGLRERAATHDANVRAALELLIWHDYWLRRSDFRRACVTQTAQPPYMRWEKARDFADSGPACSSSQLVMLRLAVAIAADDLGLQRLGAAHRRAAVKAFAQALGTPGDLL